MIRKAHTIIIIIYSYNRVHWYNEKGERERKNVEFVES